MSKSVESSKPWRPNIAALKDKLMNISESVFWTPREGTNQFRILPPREGEELYWQQAVHYGVEDEEGNARALPCLAYMQGEKCPVCQLIHWLKNASEGDYDKIVRRLSPRANVYFQVVPRELDLAQVKVWRTSTRLRDTLLEFLGLDEYADAIDPEEGRDWILVRKGSGLQTRYPSFLPSSKVSPVGIEDLQSKLLNIGKQVEIPMTYEEELNYLFANFDGKLPMTEVFE